MKKNIFIITLLVGCCSLSAWAQKQEKTITVEVNNNWNRAKTDEPVVINLRDLHTGFKVKSAVVMEGSTEIPSQLDDLNRDRKMDELAFVTSLPAHGRKTFQVTLSSEKSTKTYPARVYAEMFIADPRKGKHQSVQAITVPGTSNIYSMVRPHGPVLESELVGYRLYFNEKQTPDIYGKFNKGLEIKESQFYPTDEQLARGFGDDVLRVFDSCGPGAFKGWDGKKATHITPVATRTERIISYGPVRVIAEIEVTGWKYQNAELDMMTRYTLYAGHRDLRIEHSSTSRLRTKCSVQAFRILSVPQNLTRITKACRQLGNRLAGKRYREICQRNSRSWDLHSPTICEIGRERQRQLPLHHHISGKQILTVSHHFHFHERNFRL